MDDAVMHLLEAIETDLHRQAIAHEKIAEAFTRIADVVEDANKIGGTLDRAANGLYRLGGILERMGSKIR